MKKLTLLSFVFCLLFSTTQSQTVIKFFTTMGNFYVEMSDSLTPITSGNFIDLVEDGFYDGVIFHRVIDGFMIQGGDPTGTGTGGPGYTIQDEFDSTGTLSNIQKTISMANTGQPNSGGSQFFINLVNNTYLDFDKPPLTSKHAVFGMVIDSFDVVQAIGQVPVNAQNRPLTPVVMDSLRVFDSNDTIDTMPPDTPEGIASLQKDRLKLKVFPNPVMSDVVITIDSPEELNGTLLICDQVGRSVWQNKVTLRQGMNRLTNLGFDHQNLSSGVYFLSLNSDRHTYSGKFIVTE